MARKSLVKQTWRYLHPTTGKVVMEIQLTAANRALVEQAIAVCSVEIRDRLDKKLGIQPK